MPLCARVQLKNIEAISKGGSSYFDLSWQCQRGLNIKIVKKCNGHIWMGFDKYMH